MHSWGQFNNVYEGNNYYSLNSNFRLIGRQVEVCFESSPSADKLIRGSCEIPPPGGRVMNRRVFQPFILKWMIPLSLSLEGEWGGYWCICFVSLTFSSALPHLQNAVKTHSCNLQYRNRCTVLVAKNKQTPKHVLFNVLRVVCSRAAVCCGGNRGSRWRRWCGKPQTSDEHLNAQLRRKWHTAVVSKTGIYKISPIA